MSTVRKEIAVAQNVTIEHTKCRKSKLKCRESEVHGKNNYLIAY